VKQCKVFLLDDHKIIRDGIKSILHENPTYKVVGEEGDPVVFIQNVSKIDMDILLLDLTFPKLSGFQIIPKVKKLRPEVKIIILSMHNDPEYMQRSAALGANGYLAKDSDAKEFVRALDAVTSGSVFFDTAIPMQNKNPSSEVLSQRELEVLTHLSSGLSSKQIAGELEISTRTVETHRLNIMKKLGTTNSAETISVAARLHLI
jgi:two-component system, NarL family, response regulator NreC